MMPDFVTFACSLETIDLAIANGATHLLLEDPKLSLRSYCNEITPGFDHLVTFAVYARNQNPQIKLSFNLDILPQPTHHSLITQLVNTLQKAKITRIRIQDPGLKNWIDSIRPGFEFELSTETGNQNNSSISYFCEHFSRQILSNEMPQSQLQTLTQNNKCEFEIQVHGPLLIQYSPRRYLGLIESEDPTNDTLSRYRMAFDTNYPGRQYPFYDNPHGHLMYLYFDRCLLTQIPQLVDLKLTSWLFDGRGETPDYLHTALSLYKKYAQSYLSNPTQYYLDKSDIDLLQNTARRPLKPGFFRANLTDQDRFSAWTVPGLHVGTIIDFEKKKTMVIEARQTIPLPFSGIVITPKNLKIPIEITQGQTLAGISVTTTITTGDLVVLPWQKGIPAQSRIYTADSKMLE